MACSLCFSSFGVFKKEVACEICGFSFCSKCCSRRSLVSLTGETNKRQLCQKCFSNISGATSSKTPHSPPLAHKQRMEKFASRSVSLGSDTHSNEKDREIAERLQKLKRDRAKESLPSQMEIEERLAKLKGMDPSKYTAPPIQVYRPSERRSSAEQTSDLLKQVQEEVKIDESRVKPEDDIAARLAHLKDEPASLKRVDEFENLPNVCQGAESSSQEEMDIEYESQTFSSQQKFTEKQILKDIQDLQKDPQLKGILRSSKLPLEKESPGSDIDEDAETDLIIEKLLAANIASNEVEDPDSLNGLNLQTPTESSEKMLPDNTDPEEFPWCIICTEDAVIRCLGCDSDLYCKRCFRECHDSLDIKDHKTCPFLPPRVL